MLIGPFGPWITALGGVLSRSGVDAVQEDAWAIVALAAGCAFLVVRWHTSGSVNALTLLLTAGLAGGDGVYHYLDVAQNHAELGVGWGLYLTIAGAAAVVLTAGQRLLDRRS